jgi:hypothetical protein
MWWRKESEFGQLLLRRGFFGVFQRFFDRMFDMTNFPDTFTSVGVLGWNDTITISERISVCICSFDESIIRVRLFAKSNKERIFLY